GRAGAEVDADAVGVEEVEDLVEVGPVVLARAGLEAGPAEDVDRDEVDAGLCHEGRVLLPGVAVPLLRVVVAAQHDASPGEGGSASGAWERHGSSCLSGGDAAVRLMCARAHTWCCFSTSRNV